MSAPVTVSGQAARLRRHFAQIVLPLWRGPGFNPALQLPFEAVAPDTHAPLPVTRYRAMACARQLFVFSQAGDAEHAHALFAALCRHFRDPRHDGWFYSVDAQGAPLDRTKDLYTHAFVVFACAEYFAAFGNRDARELAQRTAALIVDRFAPQPGNALLDSARGEDFAAAAGGPLQNPLMHLTGLPGALARAYAFAQRHGVDPDTGGVCAATDARGACIDGTQRIWAQTEYLRALATHGGEPDALARQIARFAERFLHPRGWYECKTARGDVSRADMPSTTPYHLATAYASLPAEA